ncbi:Ff.00g054010.m01.CDS01 [Fusarium sp. VM40]|nr:Ff.00g054010.m01.CDS01 [Fusarium sp. VM40]
MASSIISKLVASAASIQNDFSLAAANLNLDFTLIKLEAPKEFVSVGTSLTNVRKENAERGSLHRTARKLGAIFDGVPPSAERLLSIYGKRVSEICQQRHIDTEERNRYGIFSQFAGTDSASLWAAATSGSSAISIHLLACMIAGVFDSAQSVALWLQLIETRKSEIQETIDQEIDQMKVIAKALVTQQEFTRDELAAWDNSARSWINTAHLATAEQRKVALLYADNAGIPVNASSDPYSSVIKAWKDAMTSMECLINGTPQRVRNGAVLLAINSWHLYPDLCVLSKGPDVIHQRDPLISSSGILTLDLERSSEVASSVTWSLPLAYLRYYGEPVVVNRSLSVGSARISIDQFRLVLLGCVLSNWHGFSVSMLDDIELVAGLLDAIRSPERSNEESEYQRSNLVRMQKMTRQNSWIGQLLTAADDISSMDPIERETALKLINHGRRHGRFLCAPDSAPAPFFGLCHIPSLFSLLEGPEPRIKYLRKYAQDLGLSNSNCVIRYYYGQNSYEYATIEPLGDSHKKEDLSGFIRRVDHSSTPCAKTHMRWIPVRTRGPGCDCNDICHKRPEDQPEQKAKSGFRRLEITTRRREKFCGCLERGACSLACHGWKIMPIKKCLPEATKIQRRIDYIQKMGERPMPAHEVSYSSDPRNGQVDFGNGTDFHPALLQLSKGDSQTFVHLEFCAGDYELAEILRVGPMTKNNTDPRQGRPGGDSRHLGHYFTGRIFKSTLQPDAFDHYKLTEWFATHLRKTNIDFVQPLRACAAAVELYSRLPEATIDSSIMSRTSLRDARWIPSRENLQESPLKLTLSRPKAFACIAMLETGRNFDIGYLRNVFAMTYGNSIFVASPLMADPYETPLATEIKRVSGNIGQPGLSFLIPPPNPRIRKSNPEAWTVLSHKRFEGHLEDSFWKTSMHLTLTQYQPGLPGLNQDEHYIDESTALRETLVQVYDSSEWVCDLDILATLGDPLVSRVSCNDTSHPVATDFPNTGGLSGAITVDNWEELLTPPVDSGVLVVRTSGNWLARLAAAGVCIRLRKHAVILPQHPCWPCTELHLVKLSSTGSNDQYPVLVL